jgi:hypothetical protein
MRKTRPFIVEIKQSRKSRALKHKASIWGDLDLSQDRDLAPAEPAKEDTSLRPLASAASAEGTVEDHVCSVSCGNDLTREIAVGMQLATKHAGLSLDIALFWYHAVADIAPMRRISQTVHLACQQTASPRMDPIMARIDNLAPEQVGPDRCDICPVTVSGPTRLIVQR